MNTDYKQLFLKYICHLGAAEGIGFATDSQMAPCGMRNLEFTQDELNVLENEIFPKAREMWKQL